MKYNDYFGRIIFTNKCPAENGIPGNDRITVKDWEGMRSLPVISAREVHERACRFEWMEYQQIYDCIGLNIGYTLVAI